MGCRREEIRLNIDGSAVAGIRQRDESIADQPRVLCLHGWLDNANSFVPMLPHLEAFDLVAIDLPGHGHSDWLPGGYTLHEMTYRASRVVEALGWSRCHLIGHSMGGTVAALLAVADAAVVQSLTLVDAAGPSSEPASKLPERLGRALDDRRDGDRYRSREYPDPEAAVEARLLTVKMKSSSARLIIDRQLEDVAGGGHRWRFDPRWRETSPQYQTETQVIAVLSAIDCRTLVVVADEGYLARRGSTEARLESLRRGEVVHLPGHHHLHMDTPESVAGALATFLHTEPPGR